MKNLARRAARRVADFLARLELLPEWRAILRNAWSVRMNVLCGVLAAIEAGLPFLDAYGVVPPGIFAALAVIVAGLGTLARCLVQSNMKDVAE